MVIAFKLDKTQFGQGHNYTLEMSYEYMVITMQKLNRGKYQSFGGGKCQGTFP